MFENIIIQDKIKKMLVNTLKNKQINHCYMFAGPQGTNKTATAVEFIKGILCNNYTEKKPCNKCVSCNKINHNNHPDVIKISPGETSIKISQVRDMIRLMKVKPYESPYKFFLVEYTETMGIPAQNALLKSLEEPNKSVIIILICNSREKVLPTVLSRCQIIKFNPINKDEFNMIMRKQGISEQNAGNYYDITQGCIGKIQYLLENPNVVIGFQVIKEFLVKIIKGQTYEIFNLSKWIKESKLSSKDITSFIIIILWEVLYDILISEESEEYIGSNLSGDMIHDIIIETANIQSLLTNNINLQLQIEYMLIKYWGGNINL